MCESPQSPTCSLLYSNNSCIPPVATKRRKSQTIPSSDEQENKCNNTPATNDEVGLDLEIGYTHNQYNYISSADAANLCCPICLDVFHVNENVTWSLRLISCPHVFHTECIQLWLSSSHSDCPCCRGNFLQQGCSRSSSSDTTAIATSTTSGPLTSVPISSNTTNNSNVMATYSISRTSHESDGKKRSKVDSSTLFVDRRSHGHFCIRHGLIIPSPI